MRIVGSVSTVAVLMASITALFYSLYLELGFSFGTSEYPRARAPLFRRFDHGQKFGVSSGGGSVGAAKIHAQLAQYR
jgi:hypothetical protein